MNLRLTLQFAYSLLFLMALDYLWLGLIMFNFMREVLEPLSRKSDGGELGYVLPSAFMVYVLLALGIVFFVLPKVSAERLKKKVNANYLKKAFMWGFFLGVIIYGMYEFTNFGVLQDWPSKLIAADIFWGGISVGLVSLMVTYINP